MRKSRLSKDKQVRLMEHFVAGTTTRTAASLVGVNKSTAAYYYHRLRELVFRAVEDDSFLECEIEVDESYFGGRRKSKRGRGAAGKVPVFGILKRGGRGLYAGDPRHKKQNPDGHHGRQNRSRQYRLHGCLSFAQPTGFFRVQGQSD
jgi:transposase-like protein